MADTKSTTPKYNAHNKHIREGIDGIISEANGTPIEKIHSDELSKLRERYAVLPELKDLIRGSEKSFVNRHRDESKSVQTR